MRPWLWARNAVLLMVGLACLAGFVHMINNYSGYDLPAGQGDGQIIGALMFLFVALVCGIWLACSYVWWVLRHVYGRKDGTT